MQKEMLYMSRKFLTIFIITVISLEAASDSIRERKKNIESGIRILEEIEKWQALSPESTQQGIELKWKLDKVLAENSRKEQIKLLPYLEQDSKNLLIRSAQEMDVWVGELIDYLQKEWPKEEQLKEWKEIEKKEKLYNYWTLAKQEKSSSQEYIRMRNPILSILALKRATIYSFLALKYLDKKPPQKWLVAYNLWSGNTFEKPEETNSLELNEDRNSL